MICLEELASYVFPLSVPLASDYAYKSANGFSTELDTQLVNDGNISALEPFQK